MKQPKCQELIHSGFLIILSPIVTHLLLASCYPSMTNFTVLSRGNVPKIKICHNTLAISYDK